MIVPEINHLEKFKFSSALKHMVRFKPIEAGIIPKTRGFQVLKMAGTICPHRCQGEEPAMAKK